MSLESANRNKSRESWMYTYNNYVETHDWFIKVDDDTFVVWPNLLTFLETKDPKVPAYYGK